MDCIERVRAALHFKCPDRVPVFKFNVVSRDVFVLNMFPSKHWNPGHIPEEHGLFPNVDEALRDFRLWRWKKPAWARAPEFKKWTGLDRQEVDEFGSVWRLRGDGSSMGHPAREALADWSGWDDYLRRYSPDPDDPSRYLFFTRLSKIAGRRRYRLARLWRFGPLTMATLIRGFNSLLTDHRRHPEELKKMLAYLTGLYLRAMERWFELGARPHGFMIHDDLGTQKRPFFSPEVFGQFYEAMYRPLFEKAHELGCEFHMHSCGKIDPLIPQLIDWGLDALEFDSPRLCGYPDLERFRGKIMFWGCINIQSIYPRGTPDDCEREVWHMVRNLGTPEGGFGAYFYPRLNHIRAPRANVEAFARGLVEHGVYSKIPGHWWDSPVSTEWRDDEVPPLPE